jgi:hypothetical protein
MHEIAIASPVVSSEKFDCVVSGAVACHARMFGVDGCVPDHVHSRADWCASAEFFALGEE